MVDHVQIVPRTRMTSAAFLALPESNLPTEVLNGEIFISPAPTVGHQRSVRQAFKVVDALIPNGEGFFAPAEVYFDEDNTVPPDVFWISNQNAQCNLTMEMLFQFKCRRYVRPHPPHYDAFSKHRSLVRRLLAAIIGGRKESVIYYSVPVCAGCADKLKKRKTVGRSIMAVEIALVLIGLILLIPYFTSFNSGTPATNEEATKMAKSYQDYIRASILTMAGFFVAFLGATFSRRRFAKWNGKLFKFYNKAFHTAFANLNPSISRKA